jgi:starch synthase
MKIVHAASELFPYVKTGGLADAVGALTTALADRGHDVTVFLPAYRSVRAHPEAARAENKLQLKIELGDQFVSGEASVFSPRKNLTVWLIGRDEYFDRSFPYGTHGRSYEDNDQRFIFFCKGVVEVLRLNHTQTDIVHAHDWQTGLLPLFLRDAERRHGVTLTMKTVFTIHNIAFQGIFSSKSFGFTNLPDEMNGIDGIEYYGQINMLKGGILFTDRVTTVSPNYAREIQTPDFGCGLDGVVASRGDEILGLANGIDTGIWNPAKDRSLPSNYSADDLAGKERCRAALLKAQGFAPKFKGPIFGMVCRLTGQKGIELLLAVKDFFVENPCRFIVLGSGAKEYEDALTAFAAAHPSKVALSTQQDEGMSHLIEAGSDFFLMPSLFEPCGLNQMYSQAYGTIPIVTQVGGLVDTVSDADANPDAGTGLMFPPSAEAFREALGRALKLFGDKERLAAVRKRGMNRDFGWQTAVQAYEKLYADSL